MEGEVREATGQITSALGTKVRTLLLPGVRYSQGGSEPRGP